MTDLLRGLISFGYSAFGYVEIPDAPPLSPDIFRTNKTVVVPGDVINLSSESIEEIKKRLKKIIPDAPPMGDTFSVKTSNYSDDFKRISISPDSIKGILDQLRKTNTRIVQNGVYISELKNRITNVKNGLKKIHPIDIRASKEWKEYFLSC